MSGDKPIPETALDVAERIFDATGGCACDDCRDKAAGMIRAALMAERERAAKVADDYATDHKAYSGLPLAGRAIATAIRNGA